MYIFLYPQIETTLSLIRKLFKLQMSTEHIIHECVEKLPGNVDNPEENESLCKLLTIIGQILDTNEACAPTSRV